MYRVGIIVASDSGHQKRRTDESGKAIAEIVSRDGMSVAELSILPDEIEALSQEMLRMADDLKLDLILTTGGTGFAARDVTPEATLKVIERLVPGIPEAMRLNGLKKTPRAMLSRAVAGIRNKTLIVNLPGSPRGVRESLEPVLESLSHGLDILTGTASECAGKRP